MSYLYISIAVNMTGLICTSYIILTLFEDWYYIHEFTLFNFS